MAERVEIILSAVDRGASKTVKGLSDSFKGLNKAAADAALKIGKASALGLGAALAATIPLAFDFERVQTDLNQTIKSTGGIAGVTADEANALADSLASVTKYSDETIVSSEAMLLTFTKIGEDIFPRAIETALDMGEKFGSVESATIQLGKALNDPIAGVGALSEVGVSFTEEQKEMIKTMVEAGDIAGAQAVILDELAVETGGLARAMGDTNRGKIQRFINQMVDIGQVVGMKVIGALGGLADKGAQLVDVLINIGFHSSEMYETFQLIFGQDLGKRIYEIVDGFVRMAEILSEMGIAGIVTLQFWGDLNAIFGSDIGNKLHEIALVFFDLYLKFKLFLDDVLIPFISQHADTLIGIFTKLAAVIAGGMIVSAILSIGASIAALVNPVTLAIAAVVLLWQAYENNLGGIKDFTQREVVPVIELFILGLKVIWAVVQPELKKLRDWFVEKGLPAIRDAIINDVIPALERFVEWLKKTWEDVKPYLLQLAQTLIDDVIPAIRNAIINDAIPAIEKLIKFLSDVWDVVQPKLESLVDWFLNTGLPWINDFLITTVIPTIITVKDKLIEIWDKAGPKLKTFYNWVNDKIGWLKDHIFIPLRNTIGEVIDKISSLIDWIGKIDLGIINDIGNAIGGLGIPGFAGGGAFQGLGMVGEQGREYVYAPGGAVVLPNSLTEQLKSLQGGGNTYNLNVNSHATSAGIISDFRMMEAFGK